MKNRRPDDAVFATCACCTIVGAGALFAALLYQLVTLAIPLVEFVMSPQVLMAAGLWPSH